MTDRASPRPFVTARWQRLAMINYEMDPAVLAGRAPRGTVVDTWNGRCFVSMVSFQFLDTRVFGVAVPLHRNFPEVNLRYYVRREVAGEIRRGVVFVKELVPRRAIAWVANVLYNENYQALPMWTSDTGARVSYNWRHGGRDHGMSLSVTGDPSEPAPDSQERFITEHYWGYVAQRDGSTLEYEVKHPPWRVWRAHDATLDCDVAALYGTEFSAALAATPSSCLLAEGSDVVVRRGVRIGAAY